ncbi:MAG TPA: hypothetical protein VNT75_30250 [Symbiobacteriaceae bacterium]|nr:hypothetical protein [Symbiobacteriaceae bacterium]
MVEWKDPVRLRAFLVKAAREGLSESEWAELAGAAEAIAPSLISVAEDDGLADSAAPVAIRLLGVARVAGAVPELLALLERGDPVSSRADAVVDALEALGEAARQGLYDLCDRYADRVDSDPYCTALEVLVLLTRDDRTWQRLRHALEQSVSLAGVYIAMAGDYQDSRAVYFLNTMLEEREGLSREDQEGALESIQMCGGVPTALAESRLKKG